MLVDFSMIVDASAVGEPDHNHYLGGFVDVDGAPARKRIVVCDRVTLEYLAVTESDKETGEWKIHHLPEYEQESLLVLAFDDTGVFNVIGADFVTQEAE